MLQLPSSTIRHLHTTYSIWIRIFSKQHIISPIISCPHKRQHTIFVTRKPFINLFLWRATFVVGATHIVKRVKCAWNKQHRKRKFSQTLLEPTKRKPNARVSNFLLPEIILRNFSKISISKFNIRQHCYPFSQYFVQLHRIILQSYIHKPGKLILFDRLDW